jgi:2-polyprenyl-3-methyl-5-hydroxy-6-metoxy-1,4-benzoquinol methylase
MPSMNPNAAVDPNLICPVTGSPLHRDGDDLVSSDGIHRYTCDSGIFRLFVPAADGAGPTGDATSLDAATSKVQEFYEEAPFPNYNDVDDVAALVERADTSVFGRLLRDQIPVNAKVLEVGCGTGQLSNYLAATCLARIYAADMTLASLRLGSKFAAEQNVQGICFLQMNLFRPCVRPGSMDLVISNGVLHHTADSKAAFMSIAPLVKPGGHIVVGLYNHIGRLRTDMRRALWRVFGDRALFLDPHLRKSLSPDKRRAWIRDQYIHPVERKHSMSEVMGWFDEAGFSFVSSIPKIIGDFSGDERLFEAVPAGRPMDRLMAETEMLFSTYGGEGGLFIMIGRRSEQP